jgi:hypothetical protein
VNELFDEIPNLRIGIIAHGDYCDKDPYVLKSIDLTSNRDLLVQFVENVRTTNGGDSDECYEYVLNRAQSMSWESEQNRSLVIIGDAHPHEADYNFADYGFEVLDWKEEIKKLAAMKINVVGIQCLSYYGNSRTSSFYKYIAQ